MGHGFSLAGPGRQSRGQEIWLSQPWKVLETWSVLILRFPALMQLRAPELLGARGPSLAQAKIAETSPLRKGLDRGLRSQG